jgi:GNAT superfamily N-acetyltransferase
MTAENFKLDNPVWHSLEETHRQRAIEFETMRFYHPDYCPFGGFVNGDKTVAGIDAYTDLTNSFYIVGSKPTFSDRVTLTKELVCYQMLLDKKTEVEISDCIITLQTIQHKADLYTLVNLVQPGYFKNKTAELGRYYGIYRDDELIAVTGERMKMSAFTEVSAVVTHPNHTGRGYAKQLIAHATNKIFAENKLPYLHVAEINTTAIKLYEKLGFRTRRKISFWNLRTLEAIK